MQTEEYMIQHKARNWGRSIAAGAAAKGFTVPVFIEAGFSDLEGFAKPGTDYDDRFTIICGDTGDTLRVNGWNCIVSEGEDA